jgi:hypothetical protein
MVNCGYCAMLDTSRYGKVLGGSYEAVFWQYRVDQRICSPTELI